MSCMCMYVARVLGSYHWVLPLNNTIAASSYIIELSSLVLTPKLRTQSPAIQITPPSLVEPYLGFPMIKGTQATGVRTGEHV